MTDTQPELAARLLLDMVAAAIDDRDDGPLEQFLAAIANDPRTVDAEVAEPVLLALADAIGPALPPLWRQETSS